MWDNTESMVGNTVYTAIAVASDYTSLTCNDTGSSCFLRGARCDLRYTISVAASSDHCSDLRSPPYRTTMGTVSFASSKKKIKLMTPNEV